MIRPSSLLERPRRFDALRPSWRLARGCGFAVTSLACGASPDGTGRGAIAATAKERKDAQNARNRTGKRGRRRSDLDERELRGKQKMELFAAKGQLSDYS